METIETIFENYKTSYNEETPCTSEQQAEFNDFSNILEKVFSGNDTESYRKQQLVFDSAIKYVRASEKAGFVLGFKMAMNIMQECRQ